MNTEKGTIEIPFSAIKRIILDEEESRWREILRLSGDFSTDMSWAKYKALEELKACQSMAQLDKFLRDHRQMSLNAWAESL